MNYRAEIDGLRAIAVIGVILYHAQIVFLGIDWFEGGFVGVDIFFVISGYLITRIILNELNETNKFSFFNFYERRARRILPMLIFIIAVCLPFAWQKLLPMDLVAFSKSALSALAFGSNFFFYFATTEYGADSALLKPLLHTWSLGVEEQFYFVAPIVLLLTWNIQRQFILTVLLAILLLSIQFADAMSPRDADFNFYLPFSRFWELFVGSIIAYIELKYGFKRHPLLSNTMPIFGLFLIAHSIVFSDNTTPHPSFDSLLPIIGVGLIIAYCSKEDLVGKVLSSTPFVGIGLISYSAYLWHFPIFAFQRIRSNTPSNYDKLEWIFAILVLSTITYFLIEKPFRNRALINRKVFSLSIVALLIGVSSVNIYFLKNDGFPKRLPPILSETNLLEHVWLSYSKDGVSCANRETNFCNERVSDNSIDVLVFGDSHFRAMSREIVKKLRGKYNYLEANTGGCPFVLGVNKYVDGEVTSECQIKYQKDRFNVISNKPSIVVIGGRFPHYLHQTPFDNSEGNIEEGASEHMFLGLDGNGLSHYFLLTVKRLINDGHQIVMVYPIPGVGLSVPYYIFQLQVKLKDVSEIKDVYKLTTSFEIYKERSKSTFELFDSVQSNKIHRVYPHTLFCDKQITGRCVTHDESHVYYADNNHPSPKGSEMIVELIMEQIEKAEQNILNQ